MNEPDPEPERVDLEPPAVAEQQPAVPLPTDPAVPPPPAVEPAAAAPVPTYTWLPPRRETMWRPSGRR
jgi:hypothetical protein